jgi:hypothetical protein
MMVLVPREIFGNKEGDTQINVGPHCGGLKTRTCLYFVGQKALIRLYSLRIQAMVSNRRATLFPAAYPTRQD